MKVNLDDVFHLLQVGPCALVTTCPSQAPRPRASQVTPHFAEFGIVVRQGRKLVDGQVDLFVRRAHARIPLEVLVNKLEDFERVADATERELAQIRRLNPMAKFLGSLTLCLRHRSMTFRPHAP
ncbi:hypothetical protein ACM41_12085 [Bradyrhizobium sp. CCBAU 21362]|nr:hypothetical protein [Bradyrhizobium sp. CCBAU 21362]